MLLSKGQSSGVELSRGMAWAVYGPMAWRWGSAGRVNRSCNNGACAGILRRLRLRLGGSIVCCRLSLAMSQARRYVAGARNCRCIVFHAWFWWGTAAWQEQLWALRSRRCIGRALAVWCRHYVYRTALTPQV